MLINVITSKYINLSIDFDFNELNVSSKIFTLYNATGDVDLSDLGQLAGNYETNEGATWSMGNFDNDGDVDLTDLGQLAGNYESGVAQAMADFEIIRDVPSLLLSD